MKILEDYKKIAQELLFEVDDEKIIKYKDTQEDVVIRPSRPPQQPHHWASFIDIEHPKHVKQHPNYVSNK